MKRISDITVNVSPDKVSGHLQGLSSQCSALAAKIDADIVRTDRTVALANFCAYIARELLQLSSFYPNNVSGLAWCARNLFETNLIVRHILTSEENLRAWLGQMLQDEKDFIDGVLSVAVEEQGREAVIHLRNRLKQLDEMGRRHSIEYSKPRPMRSLAKGLGIEDEYVGLYKLFSKYVHPTSLLINAWSRQEAETLWLNVFLVKAQIYAGDTVRRIEEACDIEAQGAT